MQARPARAQFMQYLLRTPKEKKNGAEDGLNGGKYYADARDSPHVQASKYEKAPRR
jgi:hypothetical protein